VSPSQVVTPFVGAEHGVQDAPQLAGSVSATHDPPHEWNPGLQPVPQAVPSHEATPPGGTGQGVHDVPQVAVELFATHELPQRCMPLAHGQLAPSQIAPSASVASKTISPWSVNAPSVPSRAPSTLPSRCRYALKSYAQPTEKKMIERKRASDARKGRAMFSGYHQPASRRANRVPVIDENRANPHPAIVPALRIGLTVGLGRAANRSND